MLEIDFVYRRNTLWLIMINIINHLSSYNKIYYWVELSMMILKYDRLENVNIAIDKRK